MNGRYLKNFFAVILIWGFSLITTLASAQTITVGLNSATSRTFPSNFYGANGQERNSVPWDQIDPSTNKPYNPGFSVALQGMNYGTLRFPAGTQANFWDWKTGDTVANYPLPSGVNPPGVQPDYPSPLSELQSELNSATKPGGGTPTQADFNMNVLDDPTCQQNCSYSPTSPNETYQLNLLNTLANDNILVTKVELGNELGTGTESTLVYPTGTDYVNAMNNWIQDIKAAHPSMLTALTVERCSAFGGCKSSTRQANWNSQVLSGVNTANDAFVVHDYATTNLCPNPPCSPAITVNNANAETMLLVPFTTWDALTNTLFPSLKKTGYTPHIWVTEYNLKDFDVQAGGTWANGLYTATYSLLLSTNARVTLALHHEVQTENPSFPDIFSGTNAFSNYGLNITTVLDGYTAQGLTTRVVDTAALGHTNAEALTFPGGPTFDGTHPKLIGETFSGGPSTQTVIINLDKIAHTVDVSGIASSGNYKQIYGNAGTYISGKVVSGGYEAFDANLTPDNLTNVTATLAPNSLTLPAFSITRIY